MADMTDMADERCHILRRKSFVKCIDQNTIKYERDENTVKQMNEKRMKELPNLMKEEEKM